MSNSTISFFPKRAIIASNPPTDELYQINLSLSQFDEQQVDSTKKLTTVNGTTSSSLYHIAATYQCNALPEGVTTEEMVMFFRSVINQEEFYQTNPDDGDRLMTVKLAGRPNRSRETEGVLGKFTWAFTTREVLT